MTSAARTSMRRIGGRVAASVAGGALLVGSMATAAPAAPAVTSAQLAGASAGQVGQAPDMPTYLETVLRAGAIQLRWKKPEQTGASAISGYRVELVPMDGHEPVEGGVRTFTTGAEETSLTITDLAPAANYQVSVRATNAHGDSAANRTTFRSLGTPGAPIVQVVLSRVGGVEVRWLDGSSDFVSVPVTGYEVEVDGRTYTATANPLTGSLLIIDGLEHATAYPITIRATSELGPGASTTVIGHTASAPEPVENVVLEPRGENMIVRWGIPHYYYPAPVTSYEVEACGQTYTSTPAYSRVYMEDFDRLTDCEIRVTAINAVGRSQPTTVMWSAPIAPAPVRDLATSSTTDSLSLSWQAPADLGHSSLADYEVVVQDRNGATRASLRTSNTGATIPGLAPGTEYTVTVRAHNVDGLHSDLTRTVTTQQIAPAAPRVSVRPGSTSVAVSWQPVAAAGSATVTGYRVTVGGKTCQTGPGVRTCTITGLAGSTWYDASVVALSSVAPSAPQVLRFQTFPVPSVPKRPAATVKVSAVSGASKLKVDVDPGRGSGSWTFKVQQKRPDGTWKPVGTYKTKGSKETRTVNLKKGTYRVVVDSQHGYSGSTSARVTLKR